MVPSCPQKIRSLPELQNIECGGSFTRGQIFARMLESSLEDGCSNARRIFCTDLYFNLLDPPHKGLPI